MSDVEIHVRLYPEEKQLIRQRADHHQLTMSEYVRRLVQLEQRQTLRAGIYPQSVETISPGPSKS